MDTRTPEGEELESMIQIHELMVHEPPALIGRRGWITVGPVGLRYTKSSLAKMRYAGLGKTAASMAEVARGTCANSVKPISTPISTRRAGIGLAKPGEARLG